MGLTVTVGLYAQNLAVEDEDAEFLDEPFLMLNEVLSENGMEVHCEPKSITQGEYYESQMWGYGGLHALRRVAAHLTLEDRLPGPLPYGEHSEDPVFSKFHKLHEKGLERPRKPGILSFFRKPPVRPAFQHLVMHSDAEGFYLPRPFDDVVVDWAERPGLGMMVGSSAALLDECRCIAEVMQLPEGFDHEADDFLELIEKPSTSGAPWQMLPIEAHSLANLIRAAKASLTTNAAIQFC